MVKSKKNIIVLCIVFVALFVGIAAVIFVLLSNKDKEVIAAAENSYTSEDLNDSFYEQHPDIVIDGVLREDCWQNKKWFKNTFYHNVNGMLPRVSYTAFPTEYGIYVAAVAEDTNLVYNGQRSPSSNSSFEFTVGAFSVGEKFEEDGGFGNENLKIDMNGEKMTFNTNVVGAVTVEGELNSGNTKGAKMEAFIPWDLLDVDLEKGIPTEVYMMPSYLALMGDGSSAGISPMMPNGTTIIYYCFDEDGYTQEDAENAVVGDSVLGNTKDATWDLSKEGERIIQSSPKSEYHNIFFKDMYGSNFIIETTIVPVGQHYGWANAGVIFHRTETPGSDFYAVMMPMDEEILVDSVNGTKNFPNYTIRTWTNHNADWKHTILAVRDGVNSKAKSQEGVKLTVVKYGGEFWYFADGKFLTYEECSYMDTNVLPGLFAINADAIFKNYSCKKIDEKQLQEYLKKHGLNHITVSTKGGGEVVASQYTAVNGEKCELTLTSKSGYRLTSLKINGQERLSDVKKKAVDGVYTISNIKTHQKIEAVYGKIDGVSLKGNILANKTAVKGTVLLTGVTNKELRYVISATAEAGYKTVVPAGKYKVVITADGCLRAVKTITLKKNLKQDFRLELSDFAPEVTVNDKIVSSSLSCWNFEEESKNKISSSARSGFASQPLYFRQGANASDFVASVTIDYTTQFKEGVDYQPDLMGGFVFNDGTNSGYIWARDTGVILTGWRYYMGLIPDAVLMKENPRPAVFTVAKSGNKLHIYFDNVFVKTLNWSEVVPNIDASSKVAVGLIGHTDKESDIQFSNWSIQKGKTAADKYISTHKLQNILLKANPKFAEALILNGKQIKSRVLSWKLEDVADNVVMGSYGYTGFAATLYFAETGKTALLNATIEYTTQFKEGVDYQPDLFGGFSLTDGTSGGWIAANDTGIAYTDWKFQRGLTEQPVLTYPDARPVKMTLAVTEDAVYVYFDGRFVARKTMDEILPNRIEGADLAFSIFANADKTCDYKFSDLSISTDADVVNKYISEHK